MYISIKALSALNPWRCWDDKAKCTSHNRLSKGCVDSRGLRARPGATLARHTLIWPVHEVSLSSFCVIVKGPNYIPVPTYIVMTYGLIVLVQNEFVDSYQYCSNLELYISISFQLHTRLHILQAVKGTTMWPSAVAVGVASFLWFGSGLNRYLTIALCTALYIILGGSLTLWQIYKTLPRDVKWVQIKYLFSKQASKQCTRNFSYIPI